MKKFLTLIFFFYSVSLFAQENVSFDGLKEINGTKLYVKVIGKGEPLLIIHGGPGLNSSYLLPWLEPLSKKFTLIIYDQRSSGKSDLSLKEKMNFETFADDIDSLRKNLGYEKLNILAHSWGGLIAANYAKKFPERVKSLIFCNSVAMNREYDVEMKANQENKFSPADTVKRREILNSEEFKKGKTKAVQQLMNLSFKASFCDSSKINLLQTNLPDNYMLASLSFYGFMKELKDYNYFNAVKTFQFPVLIIRGACDIIPLKADEELLKSIKNSQFIVFEQSGHFPFIEENKKFTRIVRKFLLSN